MANDIAAIHAIKTRMRMTDDDYRALLIALTGKNSTKAMAASARAGVRKHFEKLAVRAGVWERRAAGPRTGRPDRALDASPEARKARALWLLLHRIGTVRNPSEDALAAYARRLTGVDALQWAARMDQVIEGLKAWAARELPAYIRSRLAALQAAGVIDRRDTYGVLLAHAAPKLNPDTFNAQWAALEFLDRAEAQAAALPQ